ncbi:MAG TPA: FHA domain-containing serine/threonine-protein kinase [Ktedonobacterales bacterium]|nr:FHA domain-containing serine/threonine-protein kinase [Ktedonobacterales bacterium]
MRDPKDRYLGKYRIMDPIGSGGMARVYRAYQESLERYVAIKTIPTSSDRHMIARFQQEAKLIARLSHQNILPVYDYGDEGGWAYIVMEYVPGGTVRDKLATAEATHMLTPLWWVLKICEQAALALDYAHSAKVIHRDVKPANMLLRSEEHMLLSDFGIATIIAANASSHRGSVGVGTPQYMAPEQGMPHHSVDGRSDIYALGVVLYQAVTNRLPFYADQPAAIIQKQISEPLVPPSMYNPALPPSVQHIVMRAMAKDPGQRYQRASEMATALADAQAALGSARQANPTARVAIVSSAAVPQPIPFVPPGDARPAGACLRCGTVNNPANRFCTFCGYDLSGGRAQVDRVLGPNGRPVRCRLTFLNGLLVGRSFVLHQDVTTIGRTTGNDVLILDGTVSRHHARLIFHNGQWSIEDAGSANGTFVNDQRVKRPKALRNNDRIRVGDAFANFEIIS